MDCSDLHINNVIMDPTPLFSEIPHPIRRYKSYDFTHQVKQHTRTSHPTRYFYIDFGLAYLFSPGEDVPRVPLAVGGDKTAPEYKDPDALRDPYKLDVYCLGNIIREHFMDVSAAAFASHVY